MKTNPAAKVLTFVLLAGLSLGILDSRAARGQDPANAGDDKKTLPLAKLPKLEKPTNPETPPKMHSQAAKAYQQGVALLGEQDYGQAVTKLERAVGFNPKNPAIRRALAMAYAGLKNFGKAYEHIEKAVELAGNDLEAQVLYGKLAEQRKEYDTAIRAYRLALLTDEAKPANPRAAFALYHLAQNLQRTGYHQAALDAYSRLSDWLNDHAAEYTRIDELAELAVRPQGLYLRQGLLLMRLDRPGQAVKPLQRARQRDRSNAVTARLLVGALVESKQLDQAAKTLMDLVSEPDLKDALPALAAAVVRSAEKNEGLALRVWTRAASSQTASEEMAIQLADAADAAGQGATAVAVLEAAMKTHPTPAMGRKLTDAYVNQGTAVQAARGLAQLLAETPAADPSVRQTIARLAEADKLPGDVLDQLTQAAGQSDTPHSLYYVAGRLAQQLDKPDRATDLFSRSVQADKSFLPAWEALVEIHLDKRQYDQADAILEKLADEKSTATSYLRAKVKLYKGQPAQAVKLLETVRENNPRHVGAMVLLAQAYERTGKDYQAIQLLEQAAGMRPADTTIWTDLVEMLLRHDRTNQALSVTQSLLQRLGKENLQGRILQARAALADEKTRLAEGLITDLKSQAADNTNVRLLDARLQRARNPGMLSKSRWDTVIGKLNEVAFRDPDNVWGQEMLAELLEDHAKYATAAAVYAELVKRTHFRPDVMVRQAELLMRQEKYDQAGQVARRLLENDPNNYTAKRLALDAMKAAKQYDQAETLVRSWITQAEDDPFSAWYHAALVDLLGQAEAYDKAQAALDAWMQQQQTDTESKRFQKIRFYVLADQVDGAVQYARSWINEIDEELADLEEEDPQAVRLNSRKDMVRRLLAYNLAEQEKYDRAHALLDQWIGGKVDPTVESFRIIKLLFLTEQDKIDQAVTFAESWIKRAPTALAPRQATIEALIDAEQYDRARKLADAWIRQLDKIISENPLQARAAEVTRRWCRTSRVLIEMGRKEYKDAIQLIKELRKDRPDEARLLSLLSGCYGELNQTDKQIEILEKLVAMAPRDPLFSNNLGYFLAERKQDLTRAERLVRNSLRANPDAVSTIDSLGWVFYKQGRFGRAGEVFLGLFEMAKAYDAENPESEPMVHPIILDHAGDTFWQLGWKKLAQEAWSHALKSSDRVKENSPDLEFVKSKTPAKIKAAEAGESPATADYDETYDPPAAPEPDQAGQIQLNF